MYKAQLAPNPKGISEVEMNYDVISETRQTANVNYVEKIDISKIADTRKFPQAEGMSSVPKSWDATTDEFQAWYNNQDVLLIETMLQSLGFQFTEIQKLDITTGQYHIIKSNPSAQ